MRQKRRTITYKSKNALYNVVIRPNVGSLKLGFGDKLAIKIITKLLSVSQEAIKQHLEKGFIDLIIDGEEVILTKDNFIIE